MLRKEDLFLRFLLRLPNTVVYWRRHVVSVNCPAAAAATATSSLFALLTRERTVASWLLLLLLLLLLFPILLLRESPRYRSKTHHTNRTNHNRHPPLPTTTTTRLSVMANNFFFSILWLILLVVFVWPLTGFLTAVWIFLQVMSSDKTRTPGHVIFSCVEFGLWYLFLLVALDLLSHPLTSIILLYIYFWFVYQSKNHKAIRGMYWIRCWHQFEDWKVYNLAERCWAGDLQWTIKLSCALS